MSSEYRVVRRPTPGPSLCRKSTGTRRGEYYESPFEGGRVPKAFGTRGMSREKTKPNFQKGFRSTFRGITPLSRGEKCSDNSEADWHKQGVCSSGDKAINWLRVRFHTHPTHPCQFRSTLNCLSPLKRGIVRAFALILIILISGLSTTLQAQSTNYPQLEEYIQIAIEDNPELRSLYHLYEAEKERAREMAVLPDPELNIMYDFNPMMPESQLGRFSVSAMQMFPWFGTLGTRRDAQLSAAEAERAQIDVRQLEILRDLQLAWFEIAEVEEQVRITEQNIELVRELESW